MAARRYPHSAMKAGAEPAAAACACGLDVDAAFQRWNEWVIVQRDYIVGGKPGIRADEYQVVASRLGSLRKAWSARTRRSSGGSLRLGPPRLRCA